MENNNPNVDIEKILKKAYELPYCKIKREDYLERELRNRVSATQLADALANGTLKAKIPLSILDNIADSAITLETIKATVISTAAGFPGGAAMIATIPVDLAQFYAHVFRISQKLAYIYGFMDMDSSDGVQAVLIVFLGVMFGMKAASNALVKIAATNAAKIGARVASKPLTKYAIFNISKKILAWLGVKLTKDTVGKAITKTIPVLGGVVSGGLTIAMYLPMARKLQKELSKLAAMSPDDLAEADVVADVLLEEEISSIEERPADGSEENE